jgi:5-methylcytosine-specific restriction endonuclease McrA
VKACTGCGELLSYDCFWKGNDKIGLQYKCKACLRRYRDIHNNEIVLYRVAHREVSRKTDATRYIIHGDAMRAKTTKWRIDNPDRRRLQQSKRRAVLLEATVCEIPIDIWDMLIEFYGDSCMYPYCVRTDLTLDHIVPLSKGGAHSVDNFQILCSRHNSSKGNHHSTDYRPYPRLVA